MEPEDEEDKSRRSIPSLAHALEEARTRAMQKQSAGPAIKIADEKHLQKNNPVMSSGSLLDLVADAYGTDAGAGNKVELTRMAVEANAARRALTIGGAREAREATGVRETIDEMRATLQECLEAVRECREMMRTLAARRDRNYF